MPEIGQYNFSIREVGIALLKHSAITSGKWAFGVNFTVNIGNLGSDSGPPSPSVLSQVQGLVLAKAPDDAPDEGLVIDASKI